MPSLRETLANGVSAENVDPMDVAQHFSAPALARRWGGTGQEWKDIYVGVCDARLPRIETAFTLRVMEAAGV